MHLRRYECPECFAVVNDSGEIPPDGHQERCPGCGISLTFQTDADCDDGMWVDQSQFIVDSRPMTPLTYRQMSKKIGFLRAMKQLDFLLLHRRIAVFVIGSLWSVVPQKARKWALNKTVFRP